MTGIWGFKGEPQSNIHMKLKLAFLLALISSAGLIAADAPKPDAPKAVSYTHLTLPTKA